MELRIARKLNGERNPLSGEMSKHTSGDVIHDDYYVEVKLRANLSSFLNKEMRETLKETKEKSKKEEKDWLIVFKQKYSNQNYALVDFSWLADLIEQRNNAEEFLEEIAVKHGKKKNCPVCGESLNQIGEHEWEPACDCTKDLILCEAHESKKAGTEKE